MEDCRLEPCSLPLPLCLVIIFINNNNNKDNTSTKSDLLKSRFALRFCHLLDSNGLSNYGSTVLTQTIRYDWYNDNKR